MPLEKPKAELQKRLGGSGAELAAMAVVEMIGLALSPFTFMISGVIASGLNAAYMASKDMDDGKLSLSKRFTKRRVVAVDTDLPISNKQAWIRNAPYIGAWAFAMLPDPFGMLGLMLVGLMAVVDVGMIWSDPRGRRLGDRLAGTQVIDET
ncbi:MAG: RDD family protein [Proteobacteria bacterium]|nr:RDD family protein [Pseudomonadota bacterium]MCP4921763.1 RDD family protein [Pseudomonadota bacterium]